MRALLIIPLLLIALISPSLLAQSAMPQMKAVEPDTGKIGDVLTVTGENLEKAHVAEIFLTDGKNDFKCEVMEQAANTVKVKVPAKIKAGRLALMVLTAGKDPKLIEQPVKVTIE
jgi:hypothetical protein